LLAATVAHRQPTSRRSRGVRRIRHRKPQNRENFTTGFTSRRLTRTALLRLARLAFLPSRSSASPC